MNRKEKNPSANVPTTLPEAPPGDGGEGEKTWSPTQGDHRVMDEDPEAEAETDPSKD
jgi:hypothetical protein